jgi:hypothetical protein
MLLKDIVAEYGPLKIRPYLSAEKAFLGFIEDLNEFNTASPHRVFLREGPKDTESGLRPREILGLVIIANVAMFLTDDVWVPGYLIDHSGKELPEDVAHDGVIKCISGPQKGSMMHFEQALATSVAHHATPDDIEAAVLMEAGRKSEHGTNYTDGMALVVMVDYPGRLGDLRKLATDISDSNYKTIYLIANTSEKLKDFVCVILKSPGDTLGPIDVNFIRPDGKPDVKRKRE